MQTVGTIQGKTGHTVMLEIEDSISLEIGTTVDISISKHREKRSRDANAYFHKLAAELAEAIHESRSYVKNRLIANYGQPEILDGQTVTYTTTAPPNYALELETPHLWLIDTNIVNGVTWYTYRVYRGSHTYNTLEMHKLIDGLVSECKAVEIEVLTPDELMRLKAYEKCSY